MSWHHSGDNSLPGTLITPFTTHVCVIGSNSSTTNIWFIVIHDFILFHRSDGAILHTNCLHPMNWSTGMCSFSESLFIMFSRWWDSKSIRFKTYHHVINAVACPAWAKIDLVLLSRDLCNAWALFINLRSAITKQYYACNSLLELGWKIFILSVYGTTNAPDIYTYIYYIRNFCILMKICLIAKSTWFINEIFQCQKARHGGMILMESR